VACPRNTGHCYDHGSDEIAQIYILGVNLRKPSTTGPSAGYVVDQYVMTRGDRADCITRDTVSA